MGRRGIFGQFLLAAPRRLWNFSRHMPDDCVTTLCSACALCCNGALFADVRLQRGDSARKLAALGVQLKQRGAVTRFAQPCSCLDGKLCRIYADRPVRCRAFECRTLQRTQAGEISKEQALKNIRRALRFAGRVRRILRKLGDTDESTPLSRRYQRVMRQPIDLSEDEHISDLRGELLLAVADLAGVLERDFLV